MAFQWLLHAIDRQRWLDPAGEAIQGAVGGALQSGKAGQKVANVLNGTWLGHPLHPALTDVPLGAWTATATLDALAAVTGEEALDRGADATLALGLAGAAASAVTGLADWQHTIGHTRRIGLAHALLNIGATALYGTSLALRRRGSRGAGRGLALLGYAAVSAAGYLGGHLVYAERMGVDHTAGEDPPDEWTPVYAEAGLRDGEPRRAEAQGVPIVLVRTGGRIYALLETCTHLGGPLSQGEVRDGSIVCPWHGSRFSLEDGRVLDGPAVHPECAFETRVRDGQIEVRAAGRTHGARAEEKQEAHA